MERRSGEERRRGEQRRRGGVERREGEEKKLIRGIKYDEICLANQPYHSFLFSFLFSSSLYFGVCTGLV